MVTMTSAELEALGVQMLPANRGAPENGPVKYLLQLRPGMYVRVTFQELLFGKPDLTPAECDEIRLLALGESFRKDDWSVTR